MHTTIAAAADWQYEASLSEANFQYFWLVTTLQENEKKIVLLWGLPLCGAPCSAEHASAGAMVGMSPLPGGR